MKRSLTYWILLCFCILSIRSSAQMADYGFVRDYSAMVLDSGLRVLPNAWNGGMNACHFNEIDLDFDGVKDLVVFDKTGDKITCYRNKGISDSVSYVYVHEWEFLFPKITGWMQLKDYNCDGKEDIFAYAPAGIQVWKNISDTSVKFKLMTPLLNSWQGAGFSNIALTYVDSPGIEDIDGDGDLDILVFFGLGAYVQMHRNNSLEVTGSCDTLLFERTFNCWGDFAESSASNEVILDIECPWKNREALAIQQQKTNAKHTGSTMLLLDINNDTLKDLVLGDVDYMNLILLINNGTADSAHMGSLDTLFPSESVPVDIVSFPMASYMDVNNDNLRDLLVSPFDPSPHVPQSYNSIWYYENTGTPQVPFFSWKSEQFLQGGMIDVGTGAYPVIFDADADGLNDLIVSDYGYLDSTYYEFGFLKSIFRSKLSWYKNTGTTTVPAFTLVTRDYAQCSQYGYKALIPAFADMDGDGDEDMVCGELTGTFLYFENTAGAGNPAVFAPPLAGWQGVDVGDNAAPVIIDLDGDGLQDLVVGKKTGFLNWYRNTGTVSSPVLTLENDSLGGVNVVDYAYSYTGYSTPCFFRDSTGLLKLVLGSETGLIFYYKDIEANLYGDFTAIDSVLIYLGNDSQVRAISDGYRTSVCVTDWNDDQLPDAIIGNYRGGLSYYKGRTALPFSGVEEQTEIAEKPVFTVFPNPCNDYLNILSVSENPVNDVLFSLFDIHGRLLMQQKLTPASINRLSIGQFQQGMYFYQIRKDKNIQSGKIVISRP